MEDEHNDPEYHATDFDEYIYRQSGYQALEIAKILSSVQDVLRTTTHCFVEFDYDAELFVSTDTDTYIRKTLQRRERYDLEGWEVTKNTHYPVYRNRKRYPHVITPVELTIADTRLHTADSVRKLIDFFIGHGGHPDNLFTLVDWLLIVRPLHKRLPQFMEKLLWDLLRAGEIAGVADLIQTHIYDAEERYSDILERRFPEEKIEATYEERYQRSAVSYFFQLARRQPCQILSFAELKEIADAHEEKAEFIYESFLKGLDARHAASIYNIVIPIATGVYTLETENRERRLF